MPRLPVPRHHWPPSLLPHSVRRRNRGGLVEKSCVFGLLHRAPAWRHSLAPSYNVSGEATADCRNATPRRNGLAFARYVRFEVRAHGGKAKTQGGKGAQSQHHERKKAIKVEQHLIKELKALYAEINVEIEKEAIKVEKSESGSGFEWGCTSESGRSSEWEAV